MSIPHPKGGGIICTCVKNHIIDEKEQYKDIGLRGFDYKLFEEEEGRGTQEVLDRYPYLKHQNHLWIGYWVKHMAKINEVVRMKDCLMMAGLVGNVLF